MSNDINSVLLVGRLVRDPESKQLSSGSSLASFSLASGRSYTYNGEKRDDTVFIDCTAWGKLGEIVMRYCTKGKQIAIRGRLKQEVWQGPDGKNRSKISIVVEDMQLLGGNQGGGTRAAEPYGTESNTAAANINNGFNSNQNKGLSSNGFASDETENFSRGNENTTQSNNFASSPADDDVPF